MESKLQFGPMRFPPGPRTAIVRQAEKRLREEWRVICKEQTRQRQWKEKWMLRASRMLIRMQGNTADMVFSGPLYDTKKVVESEQVERMMELAERLRA